MEKKRVMPIMAGALMAVSLGACQGMMGEDRTASQTSSTQQYQSSATGQQAVSSDLVRDVQRGLASRGYDVGPQDGIYGDSTQQALRRFQRDQRIQATGQIDGQTLAALGVIGGAPMASAPTRRGSGEYVPTSRRQGAMATTPGVNLSSDQVREVQQNLAERGYGPGRVDGIWGPRTQQALSNFQRDQNMRADGRPNDQTLAALGVGGAAPATQTGQLPESEPGAADVEPQQQRVIPETEQQQGQLPPAGPPAPGAAPEMERSTINPPGGAPDIRPQESQPLESRPLDSPPQDTR